MTANKNLLRMKFARVIEMYAERNGCSLSEALDFFIGPMSMRKCETGFRICIV